MTKSKKTLLAGAALAGMLAGTGVTVQASTLLPGLKSSVNSAQDQAPEKGKKADKKAKEKHACKGQNSCKGQGADGKNSCKGKGSCATDGSKKPA
jgi:hypothetical protein